MLDSYLPRSQAALKRHQKRIAPELAGIRQTGDLAGKSDLELVLYALGDEPTQRALMAYWQGGGSHPVTTMAEDDVQALDRAIARSIVLAATCDPAGRVRRNVASRPRR